jgi:hypothetical protein
MSKMVAFLLSLSQNYYFIPAPSRSGFFFHLYCENLVGLLEVKQKCIRPPVSGTPKGFDSPALPPATGQLDLSVPIVILCIAYPVFRMAACPVTSVPW